MNVSKRQLIIWIICAISITTLASTGIYLYESRGSHNDQIAGQSIKNVNISFTDDGKELSYQGQAGKTALRLLQDGTTVTMNGFGENAYVIGINGLEANMANNEFWAFYINGETASVGSGSYTTLDSDNISWKLSTF